MSREIPILFSAPMVLANRAGLKSETRRLIKPRTMANGDIVEIVRFRGADNQFTGEFGLCSHPRVISEHLNPSWQPGDSLWVRENLIRPDGDPWLYSADKQPVIMAKQDETAMLVWAHHKQQDYCPSIHMPRWACRNTYTVLEVRAERLQDITEDGSQAEGITDNEALMGQVSRPYASAYATLWDCINGKDPAHTWAANPWVWVIKYDNPVCKQVAA